MRTIALLLWSSNRSDRDVIDDCFAQEGVIVHSIDSYWVFEFLDGSTLGYNSIADHLTIGSHPQPK